MKTLFSTEEIEAMGKSKTSVAALRFLDLMLNEYGIKYMIDEDHNLYRTKDNILYWVKTDSMYIKKKIIQFIGGRAAAQVFSNADLDDIYQLLKVYSNSGSICIDQEDEKGNMMICINKNKIFNLTKREFIKPENLNIFKEKYPFMAYFQYESDNEEDIIKFFEENNVTDDKMGYAIETSDMCDDLDESIYLVPFVEYEILHSLNEEKYYDDKDDVEYCDYSDF